MAFSLKTGHLVFQVYLIHTSCPIIRSSLLLKDKFIGRMERSISHAEVVLPRQLRQAADSAQNSGAFVAASGCGRMALG